MLLVFITLFVYHVFESMVYVTDLCHEEALREQHDLTDLLQIWHDHHHGSEESLDGLRQLCPASIARVHGDEDAHTTVHADLLALKLWGIAAVHGQNTAY